MKRSHLLPALLSVRMKDKRVTHLYKCWDLVSRAAVKRGRRRLEKHGGGKTLFNNSSGDSPQIWSQTWSQRRILFVSRAGRESRICRALKKSFFCLSSQCKQTDLDVDCLCSCAFSCYKIHFKWIRKIYKTVFFPTRIFPACWFLYWLKSNSLKRQRLRARSRFNVNIQKRFFTPDHLQPAAVWASWFWRTKFSDQKNQRCSCWLFCLSSGSDLVQVQDWTRTQDQVQV